MSQLKIEGRITHLAKTAREISDKFRIREFVVEIAGDYPQLAKFQTVNDKTDLLDDYAVGDEVTVSFDIRGRQTNDGKVFSNLQAWRIERAGIPKAADSQAASSSVGADADDEIPFAPVPWAAL